MRHVRGSQLAVEALETAGVRWTFGIPGTHNIELYDALDRSKVDPILVADERSAAFLADGIARSGGGVGVLNLVPGAGATHAASGIAEAFMDQVPMVVLSCGIRNDTGTAFQLHSIDQVRLLQPISKAVHTVSSASEIYPAIRRAFEEAVRGVPGPVVVEIPANLLMLTQEVEDAVWTAEPWDPVAPDPELVDRAVAKLERAQRPLLYVGRGAAGAVPQVIRLAEALRSPVATTIQGKGVFPERHPLFLWNGLGAQAPPFVRKIGAAADCVLAIGCRFAEVATGSYGFELPRELIHVDLDAHVFDRNYQAALSIESDAGRFLDAVLAAIGRRQPVKQVEVAIAEGHRQVVADWRRWRSEKSVTPWLVFDLLQEMTGKGAIYTADSGNGTFLAMEHLRLDAPNRFLAPVDFSAMGYSVPAAIGAKLSHPDRDVVALSGDGAFLMTGMELLTASRLGVAPLVLVLRDGMLVQIAQFQRIPLGRATCSELPLYGLGEIAAGLGCETLCVAHDDVLEETLEKALQITREERRPVVLDVAIDYSQSTWFTKGVVKTNFFRLPRRDRWRMLGRALVRRVRR